MTIWKNDANPIRLKLILARTTTGSSQYLAPPPSPLEGLCVQRQRLALHQLVLQRGGQLARSRALPAGVLQLARVRLPRLPPVGEGHGARPERVRRRGLHRRQLDRGVPEGRRRVARRGPGNH